MNPLYCLGSWEIAFLTLFDRFVISWNLVKFHPFPTKWVILEKSSQGRTPHEGLLIKRNTFSTFPEAHPDARLRSFRVFARENWKSTLKTWKSPFSLRFHKNSSFRHPKQVKSINLDKLFLAQIHASRQGGQKVPKTPKSTKRYGISRKHLNLGK